jgi:hypothetical protein
MLRLAPFLATFSTALVLATFAGAPTATVEAQFRTDCEELIRALSPRDTIQDAEVAKRVNEMVTGVKSVAPGFLRDEEKPQIPSGAQLEESFAQMVRLIDGEPTAELWRHYLPKWRANQLNPQQTIIFMRMIRLLIDEAEERRRTRDERRTKG